MHSKTATALTMAGTRWERPFANNATTIYIGRNLTLTGGENDPLLDGAASVEFGLQVTAISAPISGVLTSVKVPWLTPITIAADLFNETELENATLWVPGGTMDAYGDATGWQAFTNKEFASYVVSVQTIGHGTLAVADIEAGMGETVTTLIDRETDVVFTVTPATGYELTTFTVNSVAQTPTADQYTVEDLSADQTVVAGFTPIEYDLTLTLNGGTASNPATYTIETATFTLTNPTKTGYDFAGWKLNGEGDAMMTVTITQGSTGHLAYTATWQVKQYTITFDSNGGSDVDPITQDYGSTVTAPEDPTRDGYNFAGWTPELPETMPAANITVTATWTKKTYTVSIIGGGVTANNYSPEDGDDVVLTIMDDPDATLTSLTVNGSEVKESIVDNHYTIENVSSNVSVVATWSSTKEFITLATSTATFSCSEDLNFTGSDLKAYIAAGYNKGENQVLLVRVYDVPANTGLVIRGVEGQTYKIPYSTSQSYFVNLLKAHLNTDDVPATSDGYYNYVLKRDEGVYTWQRPTSGTMRLGEKKAYLQIPASFMPAAAREIKHIFEDDSTTDLSKFVLFNNGKASGRIYNLNGQQVDNIRKGVYIVNGRKVMK